MTAGSDELSPVEVLVEEFLERQQRGEKPTIGEYCQRHPELAEEIREVFEALAMVEELKPDSNDATGTFGSGLQTSGKKLDRVGDYRILREIGRGGMGVVYEAEQESLGRRVALKVLPRQAAGDAKSLIRFQREARAAARMHHTNIVPVFDVGEDEEHVYYAMQMIQGQALDLVVDDLKQLRTDHVTIRNDAPRSEILRGQSERQSLAASLVTGEFHQENLIAEAGAEGESSDGSAPAAVATAPPETAYAETVLQSSGSTASAVLPGHSDLSTAESNRNAYFRSVAEIGLQTGRALSYAHARGIIHRDIKPSNLILDSAGVVWVTDFGLAKTSDEAMTHTGDILGTIRYMSPERFRGECDVRADIYSLGLTLYEMLVLRPAFASPDRLRLIELVSNTEPPTPRSLDPRIPRDLETIILKSIDKDARRRYQSADELCEDLERFIQDEPIKARRVSLPERLARWSRRNKGLAAALATVGALLLVINIAGPLLTWQMAQLNAQLQDSQEALEVERDQAEDRARENAELARERDIAARNEAAAAEQARRQQELTRRNLYASEINMAQLAGDAGDMTRRAELLGHWRTTDEASDLRGWEWYHLLGTGLSPYTELPTNYDYAGSVAWSSDGSRVASGGVGVIHVWDSESGELLQEMSGFLGPAYGLAWHPGGDRLASGGVDQVVRIWDVATGNVLVASEGHEAYVFRVEWDPQGERLASASFDGTVKIWDPPTGRQLQTLAVGASRVYDVDWHPEGDRLAIANQDERVSIWSVETGERLESFQGHADTAYCVDWHPDGERLASSGTHGEYFIWRLGQTEPVRRFETNGSSFSNIAWSSDGNRLATAAGPNGIQIRDGQTFEEIASLQGHSATSLDLCWSSDGMALASCAVDGSVRIWPIDQEFGADAIATNAESIPAAAWSPDGYQLVTGDNSGRLQLWDVNTRKQVRELVDPDEALVYVAAVTFSPDGDYVAAGGRLQNEVLLWETSTGQLVRRLTGPGLTRTQQTSGVRSLAWNHETGQLAAGNSEGDTLIWDPQTGELLGRCDTSSGVDAVCFVPGTQGRWLVTGHYSGDINLWDVEKQEVVQQHTGLNVSGLAINAEGTRLAVVGGRQGSGINPGVGTISVWDIERTPEAVELINPLHLPGTRDLLRSAQFFSDGRRLVAGEVDGHIHIWDVTGALSEDVRRELILLDGETTDLEVICVAPDGLRLATTGAGGNVRIWDPLAAYSHEYSPKLLPSLEQRVLSGVATQEDYLLQGRIHARRTNWTAAAANFDRLFQLDEGPEWYVSDLWMLDGPLPGDLDQSYPPEQITEVEDLDLLQPVAGVAGEGFPESLRWRPEEWTENAVIDFGPQTANRSNVSGYALLRVYAARGTEVGLISGADDMHRIWLNGELVQENLSNSREASSEHAVPIRLKTGWNNILAKVVNEFGRHQLSLSLSDDPRKLAPIYQRSSEVAAAEKMWNQAIADYPDHPELLLFRGMFHWRQGREQEADRDFALAMEGHEETASLWSMRARFFFNLRREVEGIADLDRAVELTPDSATLLLERGGWNVRIGRFDEGATDIRAALAINPEHHWSTISLASLLLMLGDDEGFEELRAKMLEHWGDTTSATTAERTTKVCLLRPADEERLQRFDRLMEVTRQVAPTHPFFAFFVAAQGMLEYRFGEWELVSGNQPAAEARFQKALRLFNESRSRGVSTLVAAHVDLYRVMAMHQLGRTERARQVLDQITETLAGSDFTQPGEYFDANWFDEFMVRTTHREASALIFGPAYIELTEGERLLAAGESEDGLQHLENAVRLEPHVDGLLSEALALVEKHRVDSQALLATSDGDVPVKWEYRFSPPPEGWNKATGTGEGWKSGPAPFASYNSAMPNTLWPESQPDIWMRVAFEVQQPLAQLPVIMAQIDDIATFYLNGQEVAVGKWVGQKRQRITLTSDPQIQPGTNVLAVHCSNVNGGAGIDAGLYIEGRALSQHRLVSAAVEAAPDSHELRQRRAALNVELERWQEAAADLEASLPLTPDATSIDWMKAVTLSALAVHRKEANVDEYHRLCNQMINEFADSDEAGDVERTLKCCLILSSEVDVSRLGVDRVNSALDDGELAETMVPWFTATLSLQAYRNGDAKAALDLAQRSAESSGDMTQDWMAPVVVLAKVLSSLAHSSLGDAEAAARDLQTAQDKLAERLRYHPDGAPVGASALNDDGAVIHDDLIADLLIREAAEQLKKSTGTIGTGKSD